MVSKWHKLAQKASRVRQNDMAIRWQSWNFNSALPVSKSHIITCAHVEEFYLDPDPGFSWHVTSQVNGQRSLSSHNPSSFSCSQSYSSCPGPLTGEPPIYWPTSPDISPHFPSVSLTPFNPHLLISTDMYQNKHISCHPTFHHIFWRRYNPRSLQLSPFPVAASVTAQD